MKKLINITSITQAKKADGSVVGGNSPKTGKPWCIYVLGTEDKEYRVPSWILDKGGIALDFTGEVEIDYTVKTVQSGERTFKNIEIGSISRPAEKPKNYDTEIVELHARIDNLVRINKLSENDE